ncbi:hypothetical protein [Microbispora sp. NPDC049125]
MAANSIAGIEDIVVEDLTHLPIEESMTASCICWNDRVLAMS